MHTAFPPLSLLPKLRGAICQHSFPSSNKKKQGMKGEPLGWQQFILVSRLWIGLKFEDMQNNPDTETNLSGTR